MEKIKINMMENYQITSEDENILSEKCENALRYLLSEDKLPDVFWEDDDEAKKQMDSFLTDAGEQRLLFVGALGIGKTRFLRRYFGLFNGETFKIENENLVIFLSGDGNGVVENHNNVDYFAEEFEKICEYYEKKYVKKEEWISVNAKKFCLFVMEVKKDVLAHPWISMDEDESTYKEEIRVLIERKPLTYYIIKLKYYLLMIKKCKNVVLVCDNIKGVELYELVIEKINGCIRNYDSNKYQGYHTKTVFVMNDYIYQKVSDELGVLFDKRITKEKKLNIQGLIDERFNYALKAGEKWMIEREFDESALYSAKSAIDELNTRFNHKYQKMILGLSMYDKKKVLQCYKKIIFNRTWVRKKRFSYAKDVKDINTDFLFNNITCIRALGCGNEQVYNPDKQSDSFIPNILYNTEEEEYCIYNLLLMKYFLRNQRKYFYKDEKGILDVCKKIWGEGLEYTRFRYALNYLIKMNIVECFIEETTSDKCSGKNYSITTKGSVLWDMFLGDSMLMELSREDYYRFCDSDNMKSGYELLSTEKQYIIFEDLLWMIGQFIADENKLYEIAFDRGYGAEYEVVFGKKRMAFYLLEGIKKSITYSSSRSNTDLKNLCSSIEDAASAAR